MRLQIAHAMPPLHQQITHSLFNAPLHFRNVPFEFLPRLHHDFRGRRRRRRAQIRHEIRDREIRFVANPGDNRNRANSRSPAPQFPR